MLKETGKLYLKTFEQFWQKGLSVLKPSSRDLEKGLELHRNLGVCENYGFLPAVLGRDTVDKINALHDRGMGIAEWKQKSWVHRVVSPTRDRQAAEEYIAAIDQAGICGMIQNVSDIGECLEYAVMNIAAHRHVCNSLKPRLFQATCAADMETARNNNQTGVFFSLTGLPVAGTGSMADMDALLDWVDIWYYMGIRFMHLSYNRRNYFADGCTEERDGGLSDFGGELIKRMNRAGIIVDVPHSSFNTTMDAIRISDKPVIATHAGCQEVHHHPRCKSDQELKMIASSGGYVGIFAYPGLLGPEADLNLLLKHVSHAVQLLGADHVAVGTDIGYKGNLHGKTEIQTPPATARHIRKTSGFRPEHMVYDDNQDHINGSLAWTNWPLITVGLVQMGLSDGDIEKILGGNLKRVLAACQPKAELEVIEKVMDRFANSNEMVMI